MSLEKLNFYLSIPYKSFEVRKTVLIRLSKVLITSQHQSKNQVNY